MKTKYLIYGELARMFGQCGEPGVAITFLEHLMNSAKEVSSAFSNPSWVSQLACAINVHSSTSLVFTCVCMYVLR